MAEMFEYFDECSYYGKRDPKEGNKFFKLRTWEEWLSQPEITEKFKSQTHQLPASFLPENRVTKNEREERLHKVHPKREEIQ